MGCVPTMNIKDPAVYELARQLASRRGTTLTGAVRAALAETLERDGIARVGMADAILEIARRSADRAKAQGVVFLADDDLYDERGLPR